MVCSLCALCGGRARALCLFSESECTCKCGLDRVRGCGPCAQSWGEVREGSGPSGPLALLPEAVAGLRAQDSGLSANPLSLPRCPEEAAWLCLFLHGWVWGLGPACQVLGRRQVLFSGPGPRGARTSWAPLRYPASSVSPAPPSPARGAGGRRRVSPGGAVPYFTRCRAGVRRSSDK